MLRRGFGISRASLHYVDGLTDTRGKGVKLVPFLFRDQDPNGVFLAFFAAVGPFVVGASPHVLFAVDGRNLRWGTMDLTFAGRVRRGRVGPRGLIAVVSETKDGHALLVLHPAVLLQRTKGRLKPTIRVRRKG